MEAIEFYLWEGEVRYRVNGQERKLAQGDREIIEFVLDTLGRYFPEALAALNEECVASEANNRYFDFRRVDLFIRCNFAEHDTLHFDIWRGLLHFEDVRCPRRGICKYEGVICKPRFRMQVPKEEGKVAVLYSRGLTADEIAGVLSKSIKTVKNQLESVRKCLHLDRTRDLIKIFSVYNGFTLWE